MGMITKFYENGTLMKRSHYDDITVQISKLDEDQVLALLNAHFFSFIFIEIRLFAFRFMILN
jgi:hypothetical protein